MHALLTTLVQIDAITKQNSRFLENDFGLSPHRARPQFFETSKETP